ncbi:hypothetical protein RMB03_15920 [Acinetobacter sp. V91_7]|uniref:hypothetical protein n=1 Tax=unclassified Acinetobacter TaxID=196816 RepID=UPI00287C5495|nr:MULTISPECIES: hypothetical protein [unclassified Acinetobacter]MDS7935954.1 hypothetical protein [Acinetobacter sp. V91_4B]MDS7964438.1 hypothetical protein [Acinetobacter sp. V91_7]MDS8025867.1 hypothetical protein [Acinetobacter sp. V91_13]
MPQYLIIAENVYKKIEDKNLFSESSAETLNHLVGVIRKEIKGTKFKLKYNFIDFDECLTKPLEDCAIKLDVSLMPNHKNKDEYILWLAGFIERITTGGEAKLPPISQFIPPDFKFSYEELPKVSSSTGDDGEMIINYFKSDAFTKIIKEEK